MIPPFDEALKALLAEIWGASARMLMTRHPQIRRKLWGGHLWNPSYYVGTSGHVSSETIRQYIARQKERDE